MGTIDKVFAGMDVIDGVGKVKNTYKSSANTKYDKIMGTKPIKTTNMLGMNNAVNGKINNQKRQMLASEDLDGMYKMAGIDEFLKGLKSGKDNLNNKKNTAKNKVGAGVTGFKTKTGLDKVNKDNINKIKTNVSSKYNTFKDGVGNDFADAGFHMDRAKKRVGVTARSIANGKYSSASQRAKNNMKASVKHFKSGTRSFGKGLAKSSPAIAGIGATGYGAYKIMKHFEDKKPQHDRNDLYPKAVGATVGTALVANALVKKNPYKAFDVATKSIGKVGKRIPESVIKSTGPFGAFAVNVAKKVRKETGLIVNGTKKKGPKKIYKKASEELDFFLEKNAKVHNLKDFTKDVLKQNVLKGGAESIFYFGVPSALSYAVGRDFRRGGTKINKADKNKVNTIVIDVPIEKKAMDVNISPRMENIIRRSADGIGRVFIPGTVSAVVGRNIMDNMKKVDNDNNEIEIAMNRELPENKARVIIQTNGDITKKASNDEEQNNTSIKTSDIVDALHNQNLSQLGKKKLAKSNVRLYNGIRKKVKMLG